MSCICYAGDWRLEIGDWRLEVATMVMELSEEHHVVDAENVEIVD